jgi:hypothetical protein
VLMYMLPGIVFTLILQVAVSPQLSLRDRLYAVLWQLSGPFAWIVTFGDNGSMAIAVCGSVLVAGIWVAVLRRTTLRNMRYVLHLMVGLVWFLSGCPIVFGGL